MSKDLEARLAKAGVPGARYHLFFCGGPDCCSEKEGSRTWKHLKSEIKDRDLPVIRSEVECFKICEDGPWLVVYPDGVWYAKVTPERFDRIRREHLEGGVPVQEWVRATNPLSGEG